MILKTKLSVTHELNFQLQINHKLKSNRGILVVFQESTFGFILELD